MKHWIKDAMSLALCVRRARKHGITGKLLVISEQDLDDLIVTMEEVKVDNGTMQSAIRESAERSLCECCEDYKECKANGRDVAQACKEWWLRFRTVAEEEEAGRAANTLEADVLGEVSST